MLMDPPSGKKKKPEVGLRVYTKAVDVTSDSRLSCVDSADPVLRFARKCPIAIVSVWTPFS